MFPDLDFLWWRLTHPQRDRLRREILAYAETSGRGERESEVREVVEHLRKHPLDAFPYAFRSQYQARDQRVFFDAAVGLHYVDHGGRRLYWRTERKPKHIRRDHAALEAEQDEQSPHRYEVPGFAVQPGEIVADVGGAEGNFALEAVERAAHVHIFEADPRWIRALEATFRPWRSKVTIVGALVGSASGGGVLALDDYFADKPAPTFLKLDVEGAEGEVLRGAQRTLARGRGVRAAVCTYHRQEDEAELAGQLRALGFTPEASRGYLLLHRGDRFGPPYFRRGLLRAIRP